MEGSLVSEGEGLVWYPMARLDSWDFDVDREERRDGTRWEEGCVPRAGRCCRVFVLGPR